MTLAPASHTFQSTPPRGRRPEGLVGLLRACRFQSTPPRGRRPPAPPARPGRASSFNPRLRAGGDPTAGWKQRPMIGFQSTPPRGRRQGRTNAGAEGAGFNPRLRAGGDSTRRGGVTYIPGFNPRLRAGGDSCTCHPKMLATMFQSTPPRGRRRPRRHRIDLPVSFNPRLRAGGDHVGVHPDRGAAVSFHASAREATQTVKADVSSVVWFQSTPPRGRRPTASQRSALASESFNPRLRAGGDAQTARIAVLARRFQSTPPRGRRLSRVALERPRVRFQSTPPRGRRHGHVGHG